jgi:hypothetical protein
MDLILLHFLHWRASDRSVDAEITVHIHVFDEEIRKAGGSPL